MRTRWIRFRVKYTWVLELWGLGSARSRTLPKLSEMLAQAGRRYDWGLPGPVYFLVWALAGPFLRLLTPQQVGYVWKTQGPCCSPDLSLSFSGWA